MPELKKKKKSHFPKTEADGTMKEKNQLWQ